MPLAYYDAHNHLHDIRLAPWRADFLHQLPALGVQGAVVNGTCEADWAAVAALARETPWVTPSFGLHPWHVNERTPQWQESLRHQLDNHPQAGIGEIGLDRWVEGHDLAAQCQVFRWQLALSAELNRAASIHCIRAWGALWDILRDEPVPARGFLLHAYAGPAEMLPGFIDRGAYFSFSLYFLHERKAAQREVFAQIPPDRLLVETDAPDMSPPPEQSSHPLADPEGRPLNHPANLLAAYETLANLRGLPLEALAGQVTTNWQRLFGTVPI